MTPEQFLAKLAALVPPPHVNLTKYAGVFANRHHLRPLVVPTPTPEAAPAPPLQLPMFDFAGKPLLGNCPDAPNAPPGASSRMQPRSWAFLLARVFSIDVCTCPRPACGGRLKLTEVVTDPDRIGVLLHGARAPPPPPAPAP
jgi:hypothetical protein